MGGWLYSYGVPQVDSGDVEGAERVVADMRSEPVAPDLRTCVYILDWKDIGTTY